MKDEYPNTTEMLKRDIDRLKKRIHTAVDAYYLRPRVVRASDIYDLLIEYLELSFILRGRF